MPAKKNDSRAVHNKNTARGTKNNTVRSSQRSAPREKKPSGIADSLTPIILVLAAVFLLLAFIIPEFCGAVGGLFKSLFFGLFSHGAWAVPFVLVSIGVFWRRDREAGSLGYKITFSVICVIFIAAFIRTFTADDAGYNPVGLFTAGCSGIGGGVFGGYVGGLLLILLGSVGTPIFSMAIILLCGIFLFGMTPHRLTVMIIAGIREWKSGLSERMSDAKDEREQMLSEYAEERARRAAERRAAKAAADAAQAEEAKRIKRQKRKPVNDLLDEDCDEGDDRFFDAADAIEADAASADEPVIDQAVFDEVMERENEKKARMSGLTPDASEEVCEPLSGVDVGERVEPLPKTGMQELSELETAEIDLSKIFTEEPMTGEMAIPGLPEEGEIVTSAEIDLMVERSRAVPNTAMFTQEDDDEPPFEVDDSTFMGVSHGKAETKSSAVAPEYVFPPLSLLKFDTSSQSRDMSSEIQQTATKLVETLRSFNVKTKIINVSRGPTITRYELQPEVGTKVRSIVNLVDDIALHLATSGVRIEAPIPGKEAVGIEVPNRSTSTVYIRELLEDESFKGAKSRVTTGLGMDVAGNPVLLDIAKMPHMLIAGTTGSGKSVCINSLIISILYKARPDEVKFILIDPKKVELNIYNGIPHLLVPVVSDPRKAAGSLHWAVTEMERRYELIEGAGVRNIKGYNDSIANDPDAEKLPQIVIIIDELADLMMTAKDDVEEAICRIAQKARAAGMHLIIGTQRPSVDVITGLIKANVPSRIAFTTVSQVDSRTIIDIAGAEKLIGRGDMLFAPVGSIKPIRVQGAFVSDDEVDAVTSFVKNNYGTKDYDQSVIDTIEREAQLCGNKKATVMGDGDVEANDGDPMLRPAIQLAVESGKISTSLIQRRLQLGYGRAAKLIDSMEQMGIVGPPQGQKPRDVLISKQEYMEMELRRGE